MSTPLEGIDHIGRIYDVRDGNFANSDSVKIGDHYQLFDFGEEMISCEIDGITYSYPAKLVYQYKDEAQEESTEGKTMEELMTSARVKLNVKGSYGAFSSELKASYGEDYLQNSSFYAFFENRLFYLYSLEIGQSPDFQSADGETPDLRALLKPEVLSVLDSIKGDPEKAEDFINTYGTHYVQRGIYGGRWQYSENIATEYYESEKYAEAQFKANYATYSAKINAEYAVDEIKDSSQSDGRFYVRGGDPGALSSDFSVWADSIPGQGHHVLCDFDDYSLQPVFVLAADTETQEVLESAIQAYLTYTVEMQQVEWTGEPTDMNVDNSGDEAWVSLDDSSSSFEGKEVIVGMALNSGDSNMKRSAIKVKNLETGWEYWYENAEDNDSSPYHYNSLNQMTTQVNRADYEMILELEEGQVATGLGVRVGKGTVKMLRLYYQMIDPANSDNGSFLTNEVHYHTVGENGNHYHEYYPVNGNRSVLIGAGFRVSSDDGGKLKGLKARIADLSAVSASLSTDRDAAPVSTETVSA